MNTPNGTSGNAAPEQKKGKKKRVLTFVYSNGDKMELAQHKTSAPSLDEAWRECCKQKNIAGGKVHGALPGLLEWLPKKLRKPSYAELERMLDLKNGQ